MADLVAELRATAKYSFDSEIVDLCARAADRVERYHALHDFLSNIVEEGGSLDWHKVTIADMLEELCG